MARLFWLSDEAWAVIEPRLAARQAAGGRPARDLGHRACAVKIGCRWRDVPPAYGPATTIYNRWSRRGLWQRLFEQVAASGAVPAELTLREALQANPRVLFARASPQAPSLIVLCM